MKYIRTKDGRIVDLEKFINEEKENPYYTDYEFEEIKNEEDCCSIHWTAIGTKENSQADQVGRRCQFGASIDSPFISQADTIEELCDGFIGVHDKEWFRKNRIATKGINYFQKPFELEYGIYKKDFANLKLKNQNGWEYTAIEWQRDKHDFIFGYVETDKSLIYVAKMNKEGVLELL